MLTDPLRLVLETARVGIEFPFLVNNGRLDGNSGATCGLLDNCGAACIALSFPVSIAVCLTD